MVTGQSDSSLCRFCANKQPGIEIFSDLGREHRLAPKILLCRFPFEIYKGDALPTFMCYNCIKKLNSFEEFYRTGLAAQKHLEAMMTVKQNKEKDVNDQKINNYGIIDLSQVTDEKGNEGVVQEQNTVKDVNGKKISHYGIIDLSQVADDKGEEKVVHEQKSIKSPSCSRDRNTSPNSKRRRMSPKREATKEDSHGGIVSSGNSQQGVPGSVNQNQSMATDSRVPSFQNPASSSVLKWLARVVAESNQNSLEIETNNCGSVIDLEDEPTSEKSASWASNSRNKESELVIQSAWSLSVSQTLKRDLLCSSPRATSHISILSVDS